MKFARIGLPCPCGKSSDAYCENEDGSGKCFRGDCSGGPKRDGFFPSTTSVAMSNENEEEYTTSSGNEKLEIIPHRNISTKAFEFYGVYTVVEGDTPVRVGFRYPNGAYQTRNLLVPKEDRANHFRTRGPYGEAGLWGKDKFDPGSKDSITITEGAYDAMAAYDMLYAKSACVSVKSSATVVSDIKKDFDYVNSFKKIYLCLDNDEAGQAKIATIASMFDFNKVYHVKLDKYKDANDYLLHKEADDFKRTWENSRRYSPSAILSTFGELEAQLKKKAAKPVAKYPFMGLQDGLNGLHKNEMIIIKGKQGIGKTEICRAIIHDALHSTETKMATIFLEEEVGTTIKGVVTYEMNVPAMRDDSGVTDEEVMTHYKRAVGGRDDRLYIHSHFTGDDESEIIDNIRFLVTVAEVEIVFLDNLTMLNTGREGEDERLRIDRITRRLRNLVNELHFCLVLIAHTNDDGTTRGSRLPDIVANTVIIMEREIPDNKLFFHIDKARFQGAQAGAAGYAVYDRDRYILCDPTSEPAAPPTLEPGKVIELGREPAEAFSFDTDLKEAVAF